MNMPSLDAAVGDFALATNTSASFMNCLQHQANECQSNSISPDPQNNNHRRALPHPLSPPKCPLLCVFYAEFDIVVGPKVCFQSPQKFMHFDVNVSLEEINQSLEETFQSVIPKGIEPNSNDNPSTDKASALNTHNNPEEYWNWPQPGEEPHNTKKNDAADALSQSTLPTSGNQTPNVTNANSVFNDNPNAAAPAMTRSPSFASSSKGTPLYEGDNSTVDTDTLQNSIFAATSEYIITGNELANQTITVSTHGMHILSRPMIISDTKRYERNSLLFAVGFVLRRNVDPRPYWPVLSNLSSTFRFMEVESEFLSHSRTRSQIQIVLEDVLVSLNSKQKDCHLLLDDANLLNLQLFRPPPPPTPPVPDYAVPILLRPEWQLQMYDWDLTINWIVPHIDGCKYVKQIAQSSEVDMDMIRACLRVLKHHGVLAHVDIFRYSNVYECTPLALELFSTKLGKQSSESKHLLDTAFWYSAKRKFASHAQSQLHRDRTDRNNIDGSALYFSSTPSDIMMGRRHSRHSAIHGLDLSLHSATPFVASLAEASRQRHASEEEEFKPRSFPTRTRAISIAEEYTMDADELGPPDQSNTSLDEIETLKTTLARLYCACNRKESFGKMLLAKIAEESKQKDGNSSARESDDNLTWEKAFDCFDHRRLITFGIVRGLINRVHQYPMVYEVEIDNNSKPGLDHTLSRSHDECDAAESPSSLAMMNILFEPDMSPATLHDAASATLAADGSISTATPSFSASPLLRGNAFPHLNHSDDGLVLTSVVPQKPVRSLVERIAAAMDGTRCDDELSCMFELPIEKLVEIVKDTGRWNVLSVFSSSN